MTLWIKVWVACYILRHDLYADWSPWTASQIFGTHTLALASGSLPLVLYPTHDSTDKSMSGMLYFVPWSLCQLEPMDEEGFTKIRGTNLGSRLGVLRPRALILHMTLWIKVWVACYILRHDLYANWSPWTRRASQKFRAQTLALAFLGSLDLGL